MKSTIILSAILSLFQFGDPVLFSLRSRGLEVVGARKNGAHERDTRICRAHVLACYTAICVVVFKLQHREPTLVYVKCTWKLNER